MPFVTPAATVREHSDSLWEVMEPIEYRGREETFVVRQGFLTDFASVPRIFTWLLPRYGRYTRPAILHDYLCDLARTGAIDRADADGIFRRAMRELGVPFLKRWLMWAAVRAGGVKEFGARQLLRPRPSSLAALVVLAIPGVLYLALPAIMIEIALLVFFLIEGMIYLVLAAVAGQPRRRAEAKPVNPPQLTWKV